MLTRVALHQTRLRTPGIGLDARGVALGSKGLVLLPSLDRLVAFLSLYTQSGSFGEMLSSLRVELLASKLGMREVAMTFAAESSDRMDRVAEVARLAGGYTFSGTTRHFVQYRDAAAPFGYDPSELMADDGSHLLYHSNFTQAYDSERVIELSSLMLRLEPQLAPETIALPGAKWVVAERGLGPALIGYFLRSRVAAQVGLAEWPPQSSFEDESEQRYLFRIEELPARMLPLLSRTPGLYLMQPVADGVVVESGFKHPVNLAACPVFPPQGLVVFFGRREPLVLQKLPALGPVSAFGRVELRALGEASVVQTLTPRNPEALTLTLRMVPTQEPYSGVTATWIGRDQLPLLRRLAYVLGPETLRRASLAFTELGAFVQLSTGIESIPLGDFYRELAPRLYVPAGYDPLPNVSPDVLKQSIDAPSDHVLFIGRDAKVVAIDAAAFVPLETALLEAQDWAPLATTQIEAALATLVPEVALETAGVLPMRTLAARVPEEG